MVDAAVTDVLRSLGAYQPPADIVEHDGQDLRPVSPEEVAETLGFAMRFDERGKARRTGQEYASKLAAEQLVQRLLASGYVILRRTGTPHWPPGA